MMAGQSESRVEPRGRASNGGRSRSASSPRVPGRSAQREGPGRSRPQCREDVRAVAARAVPRFRADRSRSAIEERTGSAISMRSRSAAPCVARRPARRRVVGKMGRQHVDLGRIPGEADQFAARRGVVARPDSASRASRAPSPSQALARAATTSPTDRGSTRLDTRLAQTMPSVISSLRASAESKIDAGSAPPESRSAPPCSRRA